MSRISGHILDLDEILKDDAEEKKGKTLLLPAIATAMLLFFLFNIMKKLSSAEIRDLIGGNYKCAWKMLYTLKGTHVLDNRNVFRENFKSILSQIIQIGRK